MTARSYLYVPATAGERLARSLERGADAVIVDLEDAVVPARKDEARAAAAAFVRSSTGRGEVWVRINRGADGLRDLAAVTGPALTGLCLAKVEDVAEVEAAHEALSAAESAAGMSPGTVVLDPLIESAAGVENLRAIARGPRVRMLQLGEADLAADLGVTVGPDGLELLCVRTTAVVASRAAGITAPIAAVSTDFRDLERYRRDSEAQRRLGFRGRACIHPAQIAVAHEVFTPSADEVARARAVLAAFDDALGRGDGAVTAPDGSMLDEAVARTARDILALARD